MMCLITLIIIHCSAVRTYQTSSAEQIDQWHRNRGWKCIGYHYVVRRDGTIETGRPESMVGAHCLHHNRHSLGICYEGGLNAKGEHSDTRTPAQKRALKTLLIVHALMQSMNTASFRTKLLSLFVVRIVTTDRI